MHRGFIKLYRKIDDHPFYKEKRVFSKYEAWLDILKDVQHKAEETEHVIGMNVIKCRQGQSIKSLRTWGDKWGWTAKKVSRFFNLLEKMNQIRQENVTVTTRITVLNYLKYNGSPHTDDTDMTHNGNTSETQMKHDCPTDKNDKKDNNDKNDKNGKLLLREFEIFWNAYDKKKDREKCFTKWKNLKKSERESALESVYLYVQSTQDKQYRKNPLTWLNGKCWNDDIEEYKKHGTMKKTGFTKDYYKPSSTGDQNEFF